ncbi:transcriptional regulator, LysR family [Burkholderia sp. lig30]|jgi:LysR family transcriptional regulator for bpeEF and oprC|nr:transcriptional regulator, LysR family [Burkholderia sp. lig30]
MIVFGGRTGRPAAERRAACCVEPGAQSFSVETPQLTIHRKLSTLFILDKQFGITMDRLQAMRLFTCIVDSGSFTRAAQQLGMQRASATQIMKQLEAHLGARLLVRTTRHVSPTLDGAAYYQRCVDILNGIDEAEASFSHAAQHPQGVLKVDLSGSFARLVVIPALPGFFARYPQVTLDISVGDRRVDLARKSVDCVVRIGELSDSSLVARRVGLLEQVTCASPGYLEAHGKPRNPANLERHREIAYLSASDGRRIPLEFTVNGSVETRELPAVVSVNNGDAYVAACEAGLGIIQVPRYHVVPQLEAGVLVEILPRYRPPSLPVSILYPHRGHLSPKLRVFIEWVAELVVQSPQHSRTSGTAAGKRRTSRASIAGSSARS